MLKITKSRFIQVFICHIGSNHKKDTQAGTADDEGIVFNS